ncbi:MAG: ShlB/FhaC/HecB family hemolysin secretion/activation protein [Nevskia sp.]|nr:ShlB/FhaC/HecB family hemolysin secretion/activation protein [Nevskia sp.]
MTTPGAITETLKQPPQLQPPGPAPQVSAPPKAPSPGATKGPTIVVRQFVFSGNTLFKDEELAAQVTSYLGHPISLGELYEAADKVAEYYSAAGYTLASVAVPAQKIKDGVVRLEVIEGHVGAIGFDGNRRYSANTLQSFVTHTRSGEVYKTGPLEKDLQNLNGLPGLAARAVLKPGAKYGTSDVTIKTQETIFSGNLVVDNYGRKDVGRYRESATVTLYNPTGIGDQLTVLGTHSTTNQLNYGYVDYSVPLDSSGLRFDANYGYARFRVAPPFPVGGRNVNLELSLQQPWVRTTTDTFSTTAGYINTRANADLTGLSIANTRLNLFELGGTFAHVWNGGAVTQYVFNIHTNFTSGTLADRNRERFRFEIDGQHVQPLPWRLQLLGHIDAVYSPDPLADTEQMSIGGPTSIRGFQSSEARGDRGYFAQLTLRRPFGMGPVTLVPRVFGDSGRVTIVDPPPKSATGNSLTSAGVGGDVLYRTAQIKVDWSYPLDSRPVSDGRNHGRVFAAVSVGF